VGGEAQGPGGVRGVFRGFFVEEVERGPPRGGLGLLVMCPVVFVCPGRKMLSRCGGVSGWPKKFQSAAYHRKLLPSNMTL